MIDVASLNEKLTTLIMLSRWLEQAERWMEDAVVIDKIEQRIQDLRQEILWEIEILNMEAEKNSSPPLSELCSQLGGIKEVSGVVK
jgi:hypothetical protein